MPLRYSSQIFGCTPLAAPFLTQIPSHWLFNFEATIMRRLRDTDLTIHSLAWTVLLIA